jgi:hypothetical protein
MVEVEADPVDVLEPKSSSYREVSSSSSEDELVDGFDVAFVLGLVAVVFAWPSFHAIAPPSESAAATLSAPAARRARWARGLRRPGWVMGTPVVVRRSSMWTDRTEAG